MNYIKFGNNIGWEYHFILLFEIYAYFSGSYLGPACGTCNRERRTEKRLPIVFHNFKVSFIFTSNQLIRFEVRDFCVGNCDYSTCLLFSVIRRTSAC